MILLVRTQVGMRVAVDLLSLSAAVPNGVVVRVCCAIARDGGGWGVGCCHWVGFVGVARDFLGYVGGCGSCVVCVCC
jgi:hypothetical protein